MEKLHRLLFVSGVLCLGLIFAQYVSAQNPDENKKGTNVDVNRGGVHVQTNADKTSDANISGKKAPDHPTVARARDLVGLYVYSPSNENLGKVEDLVIDPAKGQIRYAVLSFGGFLGMGDKYFAVPWNELKIQQKGETSHGTIKEDHYVLDVKKEALKSAPGFEKSEWPDFANPNWAANVDKFYKENRSASRGTTTTR